MQWSSAWPCPRGRRGHGPAGRARNQSWLYCLETMYSFWIVVFLPAADGNPPTWLTSQSATPPPNTQPLAPGTENALSTCLAWSTSPASSDRAIVGLSPVMGVLGAGGLVLPVVRCSMIGLEFVPTVQLLPRNG